MKCCSNARDDSISFVRLIATCFIVTCHFLQYYGNGLDRWFNVGVQMFFFISGYLYANKNIPNDIVFIKKNFVKILVPYYIFVFGASIVGLCFSEQCQIIDIIKLLVLFGNGNYQGVANLWFIPFILLCYLLTPFFIRLVKYIENRNIKIGLFCTFVALVIYFEFFCSYYTAAWMICYCGGIIIGRLLESKENPLIDIMTNKKKKILKYSICLIAIVINGVQIYIDYNWAESFEGKIEKIYSTYCNYSHVFLGGVGFFCCEKSI